MLSPICASNVEAQTEMSAAETAQRGRDATAAALVRLIAVQMPSGFDWRVFYQPQIDLIEVENIKQVQMEPPAIISGPDMKSEPIMRNPDFSFRVQPLVSPAEYIRFKAENAEIDARLEQTAAQLKAITSKPESFSPRNADEKQRVEFYFRVKAQRHDLPEFYFRDISLSRVAYGDAPPTSSLDRARGKEISGQPLWFQQETRIARATLKLLTRYEPAAR